MTTRPGGRLSNARLADVLAAYWLLPANTNLYRPSWRGAIRRIPLPFLTEIVAAVRHFLVPDRRKLHDHATRRLAAVLGHHGRSCCDSRVVLRRSRHRQGEGDWCLGAAQRRDGRLPDDSRRVGQDCPEPDSLAGAASDSEKRPSTIVMGPATGLELSPVTTSIRTVAPSGACVTVPASFTGTPT
ncbi:hypothetical protein [Aeromicrobium sp. UC242_57]|uniref:hypothetical protein n=1 Tax=Aeromicrobium sp. UC242_57 TaxID=3374624 RepID=UPI0037B4EEDA